MSSVESLQKKIPLNNQIGLIGLLLCAFSSPLMMLLNIEAIILKFVNVTNTDIGWIGTYESLFISISSITFSRLVNKLNTKKVFFAGALLVMIGNFLTIFAPEYNYIILSRIIAGLGSGAIVANVVATIARGSNNQMTFALLNSGVGVMGILLPFLLNIIIASNGIDGSYSLIGIDGTYSLDAMEGAYSLHFFISLFTFFFLFLIKLEDFENDNMNSVDSYKGLSGWIAMFGTSLIFLAHAGLFLFVARIGASLEIPITQITYILMVGGVLTIFGPLIAGFIGQRFGSLIPCLLLIMILLVAGLCISNTSSPVVFFISVPLCGMIPMILTPFFLGAMAKLDSTGSLAAAHPAFSTMGGALGPVVMGYASDWLGYSGIGWVLLIMLLIGSPLISIALFEADKK